MTLPQARAEIATGLRTAMGWQGDIVSEYVAYDKLPAIVIAVQEGEDEDIAGETMNYELDVEVHFGLNAGAELDKHREGVAGGLYDALENLDTNFCTIIPQSVSAGKREVDLGEEAVGVYLYVSVACEMWVDVGEEVLPADAVPPVLPADLSDIWGITIMSDILYLTEGTPTTIAESDIHSYDLTDNTRRSVEISAGIHLTQHHRGLDNDGAHLYLVDDDGTRGTWVLNKVEIATNTLLATADLGAGAHTGCAVSGANGEFVSVAVDRGSTTDFKVFNTADLSVAADAAFSETFGEVAGTIWIAGYAYDVVGATAICTDDNGRRGDLDIDLGGFRIQWHDLARRNDYLWVSGTQDNGDGTVAGLIKAFNLPPEVIRAAG